MTRSLHPPVSAVSLLNNLLVAILAVSEALTTSLVQSFVLAANVVKLISRANNPIQLIFHFTTACQEIESSMKIDIICVNENR